MNAIAPGIENINTNSGNSLNREERFVQQFNNPSEALQVRNIAVESVEAGFNAIDTNEDGIISSVELLAGEAGAIASLNDIVNSPFYSGTQTAAEIASNISIGFTRLDTDQDGIITTSEIDTVKLGVVQSVQGLFEVNPEDRQLTRQEVVSGISTAFENLDANSDGIVNINELGNVNNQAAIDKSERSFTRRDQNNDGLLSNQESFNFVNNVISGGFDINEDNQISVTELQEYYSEQISNRQLSAYDDNSDGNIDINEYGETCLSKFESLDRDNDNILDLDT